MSWKTLRPYVQKTPETWEILDGGKGERYLGFIRYAGKSRGWYYNTRRGQDGYEMDKFAAAQAVFDRMHAATTKESQ